MKTADSMNHTTLPTETQRKHFFSNNAYYILGLSGSTSQQEINRRAKELNARLKIGDVPVYESDLTFLFPIRDVEGVKNAIQELSQPQSRLVHHFFWFSYEHVLFRHPSASDYSTTLLEWKRPSLDNVSNFYNAKNIALLQTACLYQIADHDSAFTVAQLWKNIFENTTLWSAFEANYLFKDDVGCSPEIIKAFKKEAIAILSNIFSELSRLHNDPAIYRAFSDLFSEKGLRIVSDVLAPIFANLNRASEKLEALHASKDGVLDENEKEEIATLVNTIRDLISKTQEFGLADDSAVRTIRDRAAAAIRTVALDLHNNLEESDYAEPILRDAHDAAGTEGERQKIERDLRVIQWVQGNKKKISKLTSLMEAKMYLDALEEIKILLAANQNDSGLEESLFNMRKSCVISHAAEIREKGLRYLRNSAFPFSASTFTEGYAFLDKYMGVFEVNEKYVRDNILSTIPGLLAHGGFEGAEAARDKWATMFREKFDQRFEGYYLCLIFDCLFYGSAAAKLDDSNNQPDKPNIAGNFIVWGFWIVIFVVIKACNG